LARRHTAVATIRPRHAAPVSRIHLPGNERGLATTYCTAEAIEGLVELAQIVAIVGETSGAQQGIARDGQHHIIGGVVSAQSPKLVLVFVAPCPFQRTLELHRLVRIVVMVIHEMNGEGVTAYRSFYLLTQPPSLFDASPLFPEVLMEFALLHDSGFGRLVCLCVVGIAHHRTCFDQHACQHGELERADSRAGIAAAMRNGRGEHQALRHEDIERVACATEIVYI
jgi:hypothetical protein